MNHKHNPDNNLSTGERFERLVDVMAALRAPDGCPWDRKQTHLTLAKYMIEEAYEAVEAIEKEDDAETCEELGDVLLQVVFHAQLAREDDRYSVDQVIDSITNKLLERHPHVFGEENWDTADEVLQQWERNKLKKSQKRESIVDGLPAHLPALQLAATLQKRVTQVGFDWEHIGEVFAKVREELTELEEARDNADPQDIEEELGDVLFSLVNLARYLDVDAEGALRRTVRKFQHRFRHIETRVKATGKTLDETTLEEMDGYWEEAKHV